MVVAFASNEEGTKFLEENKNKEGVITLPSGLQYKVLRKGTGTSHPTVDSPCECHYAGQLIDGTEFDSSYARGSPTTFAPNQVIKGWTVSASFFSFFVVFSFIRSLFPLFLFSRFDF